MNLRTLAILILLLFSSNGPLLPASTTLAASPPAPTTEYSGELPGEALPPIPAALANEASLLVAWKSRYRMGLYAKGQLLRSYIIGLGQAPSGHKQRQGDNRTPEGDYRIIQKSRGPFSGAYAEYLGVAWLRINYPNATDASNGYRRGLISKAQQDAIIAANREGREPPKNTRLGGGIGIHGWRGKWPGADRQNLTWGCLSLQNQQLDDLYRQVAVGTRLLIYP